MDLGRHAALLRIRMSATAQQPLAVRLAQRNAPDQIQQPLRFRRIQLQGPLRVREHEGV